MANPTQSASAPGKKSRAPLFAIVGLIIGLGGGGGAYWVYASRIAKPAPAAPEPPKTGIVPMEPFVVNLADAGGSRFLRVTLSLIVEGEEHAREMAEDGVLKARVRSAILERLTLQTAEHLVTPEGKAELKKVIAEQASHAAHGMKVTDVLLSEFVVQF